MSKDIPTEPSIEIEWDITFYNEVPSGKDTMQFLINYDDAGEITLVPTSLIDVRGEEAAFEEYTGFSRIHIIHWDAEVSEDEVTASDLDTKRKWLHEQARFHAKKCDACAALHYKEDDDEL